MDAKNLPEPKRKHGNGTTHTDQEKEAGLLAFVLAAGRRDHAAAICKEHGYEIPATTIYRWSDEEPDRLERIRQEVAPKLKAQMAELHQGLAVSVGEIEAKAINRLNEKLDDNEIEGKDLSAVMQRAAIAGGIHGEKHLLYSGQPTAIVRRDFDQIKRALKEKGIVIDGSAVEIP